MHQEFLITLANCTKSAGNKTILDDITIQIEKSEIVALVGKSGAGKSTILQIIAGLIKPDQGSCTVKTNSILVTQTPVLFANMNIFNNLVYPAIKAHQISQNEVYKLAEELLARFHLMQRAENYPNEISGGQAQLISILRAIIINPGILLLDEPTSSLDSVNAVEIAELLKDMNKRYGTTILVSSHEHEFIKNLACRIITINSGILSVENDYLSVLK